MADKKSGWTPGWKTGGSSSSSTGSSGSGSSGNGSSAINGWTPGWKTESTNTSTSEVVDAITTDIKKPRRASNDIATPTYAQRIAADPTIKRLQEQKDTILSSKNPNDPLAKRGIAEIDRQIEEATKAASRSYAEKNESVPRNPITGNVQFLNPLVPFEDWGKQDIVPQSAMTPVANGWGTNPFTGEYDPSQYAGQYLPYNTEANNAQRAAEAVANPAAVESAAQREQAKAFVEAFADNGLHITGDTLDKLLTLQSQKKSILNSEGANDPRAQRGLAEIDRQMEAVLTPWLEENADAIADNYLGKMGVTIDGWDEASVILKKVLNFNDIDNQINDLSGKIAREVDPAKRAQLQADQDALLLQLDNARDNIEGGEDGGKEALKPVYESLNQVIEEMTNRYFNSADPTEKEQIYSALLLLNDRQAKLMSALGIEDRPFVNWEGRDELVSEYRRIRNTLNPTDQNGNKLTPEEALNYQLDIKNRLIEGDLLSGNGARSYSVGDWFANVINGTTENLASSLVSAPATTADFFIQNALGLTGKVTGKDYLNNNSGYDAIRNGIDAAYSISKELGDDAAESVERAKRGQNFAVRAGADILENGLQMGFDLGLAYVTGGSSLIPMGIRSFGGSAQEARDEGADINQQMAYGAVKAAIEVATEKMFDVAGFYGGGSMDGIGMMLALGRTKSKRALAPLLGRLAEVNGGSSLASVRAVTLGLEALGDPRAAEPLAKMLEKPGFSGWAVDDFRKLPPP